MKCPKCWADKAYRREVSGFKGRLLKFLFIVSLRCHHCYHKFHVPWLSTIGKKIQPPAIATVPQVRRPAHVASGPATISIDSAKWQYESSTRRRAA